MSGTIEQIKSKLDIVDVVGSYLKLEKAGGNLKAKCPFHNEKSASFFVSPARGSFHCFGCNKGGDIFEFVKEMEGIEFVDALKMLATRAGIKLVREDSSLKSEKGRLFSAIENATIFFKKELERNGVALEYLRGRGLTAMTIADFNIGFAPDSWRNLYDYLRGLKFSDLEIEKAGLSVKSPKGYYDRFRNRVMFPINNISGVTVGFSGRIFGGQALRSDSGQAKYINSPQTDLYDKSKVLFGFDRGRVSMRTSDSCILVEGQMDLIMSHQAGNLNTVAVSGTALTEEHIKNIKRLANKLTLAFDGDEAGFKASGRGIDMALAMGMDVRIARLPNGLDPADLILKNPSQWVLAITEAKHVVDFYLETLESRGYEPRKLKIEVERLILPYVARIKSSIEQAHFVNLIARSLSIDEAPIWDTIRKIDTREIVREDKKKEDLLQVDVEPVSRGEVILQKIMGIFLWQRELNPDKNHLQEKEASLKEIVGEGKYFLSQEIWKNKKDGLIFEAEISFSGDQNVLSYLDQLILNLKEEVIKEKLSTAIFKLKKAESKNDQDEVLSCLNLCQKFSQELVNLSASGEKNSN